MSRPVDVHESLKDCLRELHLPAMRGEFEAAAQRARQESQSYERYLLELTERECQARRANRIERLLRDSRLPLEKSLSSLDLKRLPPKVAQQVRSLLEGDFADRRENVLIFGNPGSREDARRFGDRAGIDPRGTEGHFRDLRADGAGPAGGEAGPEAERLSQEAFAIRGADPG